MSPATPHIPVVFSPEATAAMSKVFCDALNPLADALRADTKSRHDLRDHVETNAAKLYQLDTEVRLLKGTLTTLVGDGTGSSGALVRSAEENQRMSSEVSGLKTDMGLVKDALVRIEARMNSSDTKMDGRLGKIEENQKIASTWMDGGRGIVFFLSVLATLFSIVGGVVAAVLWLYKH